MMAHSALGEGATLLAHDGLDRRGQPCVPDCQIRPNTAGPSALRCADQTHIALGLKPPLLKHPYRVGCCENDLPPTGFPAKPPQQTKRERALLLGQIAGRPSKEKWCVREVTAELQPGFEPIGGPVSEC